MRHDPVAAGAGVSLGLKPKRAPAMSKDTDIGAIRILQQSLDADIPAALDRLGASSLPYARDKARQALASERAM